MIGLTLYNVEISCLEQFGVCVPGLNDMLWLAQVSGCETVTMSVFWMAQVGSLGIGLCEVL